MQAIQGETNERIEAHEERLDGYDARLDKIDKKLQNTIEFFERKMNKLEFRTSSSAHQEVFMCSYKIVII